MEAALDTMVTLNGTKGVTPAATDPVAYAKVARAREQYLKEDVYDLFRCVRVATKTQAWEYFKGVPQEEVSRCLHALAKENQIYVLADEEDADGVASDETYTTDMRAADPEAFRGKRDDMFDVLRREKRDRATLHDIREAFWLFLELKDKNGAKEPCALSVPWCPGLIFTFSAGGDAYEVFRIHKGDEESLATLPVQDKQTPDVKPQRIFMIDDESQISAIEAYGIAGIRVFALTRGNGEFTFKTKD